MKTDITKEIEKQLQFYSPTSFAGIRIDKFRKSHIAFEVPVMSGDIKTGLIDAVRIDEAFFNEEIKRCCQIATNGLKPYHDLDETLCKLPVESMDVYCNNVKCRYNTYLKSADISTLITCFEIKVTKADFQSSHGHNFVGNANYYIIPSELYKELKTEIPNGIGCITYSGHGAFRKVKECEYKAIDKEFENSLLLSMLKKHSKPNLWQINENENQLKALSKRFNEVCEENIRLKNIIDILFDEQCLPKTYLDKFNELNWDVLAFESWLTKEWRASKLSIKRKE